MKFDIVVGNPPFQSTKAGGKRKDQASNLWSKFWIKSIEVATDNGIISLITPTSWTSPSDDFKVPDKLHEETRLWNIFNRYSSLADVTSIAKHFAGVGSTFGVVIVNKGGTDGLRFVSGEDTTLGFLPKSGHLRVATELSVTDNLVREFKIDQCNTSDLRVCVPLTRSASNENIVILNGNSAPNMGSSDHRLYVYIHVNTEPEAQKVKKRLTDCIDVINVHCRFSGFANIKTIKMIKY
jgi:hypothetical protein